MSNLDMIIILSIIGFGIISYISIMSVIIFVLIKISKSFNYYCLFEENKFNLNYKYTEDDLSIIDSIVLDELNLYVILFMESRGEKLLYINEDTQKEMVKTIFTNSIKKISPIYLNKLRYIYNEDVIEDIFLEKVKMSVINYSIDINGNFNDNTKKPPNGN